MTFKQRNMGHTSKFRLNKPINGLLSFIEFGPMYRSYLENGRRFAHIRWIPGRYVGYFFSGFIRIYFEMPVIADDRR